MLNKYWREYPILLQIVLLTLMVFTINSFMSFVFAKLVPLYSLSSVGDITKLPGAISAPAIKSFKLQQMVYSCSFFVIPTLVFAYLTTPRPAEYLGFKKPQKPISFLWVFLLMAGIMPFLMLLSNLMHHIDFGRKAANMQEMQEKFESAMLYMDSFGSFVIVFVLLAIVPAVGEEMMFRGLIMKFSAKRRTAFLPTGLGLSPVFPEFSAAVIPIGKMLYPIFVSAFMFAYIHFNIFGGLSIFIAGILLATIYYLTGSLWCNIFAHTIFNGLQIVMIYAFKGNETMQKMVESDMLPWYVVIIGLVAAAVGALQLWKNRTPLTYAWTEDFTAGEIINKTNQ